MTLPPSQHEGQPMRCPVCKEQLHVINFKGVELDVCTVNRCGIWFDKGELGAVELSSSKEHLQEHFQGTFEPKPLDESFAEGTRLCPRDGSELEKYHWNLGSGIVLDRCTQDGGIWMDYGELDGYAAYIQRFRQQAGLGDAELSADLASIASATDEKHGKALVPWDFGVVDDMLRGMIGLVSWK